MREERGSVDRERGRIEGMSERKNKAFFSEACCHGREWGECPWGVGVVFQRRVSFPPGSGQRSPHSLISRCMREVRRAQTTNRVHAGKGGGGGCF